MGIYASHRFKITALICALLLCISCTAYAQYYRLGDEDEEIATIQSALKQLKFYTGDITGHFGTRTKEAVVKFQKKYKLQADGIVGDDTLQQLYSVAGIEVLPTTSVTSSTSSSSSSSGSVLHYGSQNEQVRQLQQNLTALGYYSGSITGHYGSKTEASVSAFQRANGLSADGVAGTKTLNAISAALTGSTSSSSSSSSTSKTTTTSTVTASSSDNMLKLGSKSDEVRTLQTNLKTLGYYSGSITGNYGNLTKEAVYNFQRANGLSADGVAGAKTLAAIKTKLASNGSSSTSTSSVSTSTSSSSSSSSTSVLATSATLMEGSKGDEVKKLQKMLASLGYFKGNQTGNFGSVTKDAVIAFQKSKGLTADGIAGAKTLAAINADYSSGSSSGTIKVASASKVIYSSFYNWRNSYSNGEYCTVYDFSTGYTWRLRIMTKDAHMDAEPVTAEDTAIMQKAFGGKTTWTPKVVWVTFSDGKTYIGSTHDTPHGTQHITTNNFKGHLCVHFPIPMTRAEAIGDYAVTHQKAINAGWELTQKMN
ncbi:MAG: peptidoglycan-binding protein [Clostridia bacterium]|nr:peptidoglycan-binding protein [Clostridia bacterium]